MKRTLLIIIAVISITSCDKKISSDLIIKNARIYSVNENFDIFESMVIRGDSILELGMEKNLLSRYKTNHILDAGGKPVYPGFIDPHCHFYGYGTTLREANLFATRSWKEVLDRLKQHSEEYPEGWITGMGWDQNDWEVKNFPDREKLDQLFPDRPVLIRRIDGHAAVANSKALEISGITLQTIPAGGEIQQINGRLTGILIDNAIDLVRKNLPEPGPEEISGSLLSAQNNCFAVGLTSVHDAGLLSPVIETIDSLQQRGILKMRIYAMLTPDTTNFKNYLEKGIFRNDYLSIRSVKLYADGALGSRGAWLKAPYTDDPGNTGFQVASEEYLREIAEMSYNRGFQVNTHCIGDAANHLMLKIYSDILKEKNDCRWRIEHSQILDPEDIKLFGQYSVIPSIQTTHATSDMYWAEERLGNRIKNAYRYKTLLHENGWLPNGSDFPIENINPLYGFYAAVARKDHAGYPEKGFQKEEALSRVEALKAMTIWASKAGFEEAFTGSLEPGKKADFVILDRDIMEIPEAAIFNVQVLETWSGGTPVYTKKDRK